MKTLFILLTGVLFLASCEKNLYEPNYSEAVEVSEQSSEKVNCQPLEEKIRYEIISNNHLVDAYYRTPQGLKHFCGDDDFTFSFVHDEDLNLHLSARVSNKLTTDGSEPYVIAKIFIGNKLVAEKSGTNHGRFLKLEINQLFTPECIREGQTHLN